MDLTAAAKKCFMELNELIKLRDEAYENTQIYKEITKKWHDSMLHGDENFKNGEKVLLFNSRLKLHLGKLMSKWFGPFVVKTTYPYGAMEITDKNGSNFKVNGQRLKIYHDDAIRRIPGFGIRRIDYLYNMEYDLWSMRMEQYLTFTDHALWEVIVNSDFVSSVVSAGAKDEHLLKFHACKDAKSLWEVIKNRFGGNKESKKMQKTILNQNYENFVASSQKGLDKTYDSTNETVNAAHSVSVASYKDQASNASYTDDVMFSFFSNQSNALQLDNEDLE
nr:hypothetical protein [Tanacetum cinerariifolium]